MNEIIQGLECNATNEKDNFCYISENKLNAIKELAKREEQENKLLKGKIQEAIDYINYLVILKPECGKFNQTVWGEELLEILENK